MLRLPFQSVIPADVLSRDKNKTTRTIQYIFLFFPKKSLFCLLTAARVKLGNKSDISKKIAVNYTSGGSRDYLPPAAYSRLAMKINIACGSSVFL